MRGEVVRHGGLLAYLNANYAVDQAGNWLVNNGPQRVYVALEYTPWVWRLGTDGTLIAHTGTSAGLPTAAFVDEEGVVLLQAELGIGVLDDRDLVHFLGGCRGRSGAPATESELLDVVAGGAGVFWSELPLQSVRADAVAARFGFIPHPVET